MEAQEKETEPATVVRVSADDYFMRADGVYDFKPQELPQAHQACFRAYIDELLVNSRSADCSDENQIVVVDNTNTTVAEVAPYVLAGESYGYSVKVIRVKASVEEAFVRQKHGVPRAALEAMHARIAAFVPPPWWELIVVD